MPTTIIMPQLGESVAEGVIGKWLKQEGDRIGKDEPIVEVITDKVNAEIPSPVAGTLQKISQPEGATVAVGQEIAIIGEDGDEDRKEQSGEAVTQGVQDTPAQSGISGEAPRAESTSATGTPNGGSNSAGDGQSRSSLPAAPAPVGAQPSGQASQPTPPAGVSPAGEGGRAERVRSSPLVRRLADQYGVNLAEVPGTGLGGRVSKQDILSFIEQRQQAPAAAGVLERGVPQAAQAPAQPVPPRPAQPAPPSAPARRPGANEELIPVSPLRKMIAERMTTSVYTIPHATTMVEVDMTNVVRYRESRKEEFLAREGAPLSVAAFVVKATVEALKEHALVNSEWAGDNIILKKDININVAVDAPEGLTTPVIHHADEKSLAGLSRAIYDLAVRARDKKLRIEDMQGGTFTVNNTGALGSVSGVSIINYPQAAILSAAAIVKRPVVVEHDGQDLIAVRSIMNLIMSFDHRVLDGGSASAFVNSVKQKLEAWGMEYPLY